MDWLLISLAVAGVGILVWIVVGDWRVRSARSFLLIALAVALLVGGIRVLDLPATVAVVAAFVVLIPVIMKNPLVMPLGKADAEMAQEIDRLHRRLIGASDAYRKNAIALPQLHDRLNRVRRRLKHLDPPDAEWRRVLHILDDDVSATVAVIEKRHRRSAEGVAGDRQASRVAYADLIASRRRFWG